MFISTSISMMFGKNAGLLCILLAAHSAAISTPEIITENNSLVLTAGDSQEIYLRGADGDIPLFTMMAYLAKVIECGRLNRYWNANSEQCVIPGPGPQGTVCLMKQSVVYACHCHRRMN
jgi:hypothetical protein